MTIPPDQNLPPPEPSWVSKAIANLRGASKVLMEFAKVAALLGACAASIVAAYKAGTLQEGQKVIQQDAAAAKTEAEKAAGVGLKNAVTGAEVLVATRGDEKAEAKVQEAKAALVEHQAATQQSK